MFRVAPYDNESNGLAIRIMQQRVVTGDSTDRSTEIRPWHTKQGAWHALGMLDEFRDRVDEAGRDRLAVSWIRAFKQCCLALQEDDSNRSPFLLGLYRRGQKGRKRSASNILSVP